MTRLNPQVLFARIARDVPTDLHQHLFVTGSLAAAYHFSDQLQEQSLNTKDADLVVHPAGDVGSCRELAERLRDIGWTQKQDERFHPRADREPVDNLPFIRLCPPESHDYFIEFLTLPPPGQKEPLRSVPVELSDGWYAVPSFRFFILLAEQRRKSAEGLDYADPAMMALANLLAHPNRSMAPSASIKATIPGAS